MQIQTDPLLHWIHTDINLMKVDLAHSDFLQNCKNVSNHAHSPPPILDYVVRLDEKLDTIQSFLSIKEEVPYVRSDGDREKAYLCECVCGKVMIVQKGNYRRNKSCGCKMQYSCYKSSSSKLNYYDDNGNSLEDVVNAQYLRGVERRAKMRGIPFEVDYKYLNLLFNAQEGTCALSGMQIECSNENGNTASVDRIDSSKPYQVGNIQWTNRQVNVMKNVLSNNLFVDYCRLISNKCDIL